MKKVKVGKEEVILDDNHVSFSPTEKGINDHLIHFGGWYAYYVSMLSRADFIKRHADDAYDEALSKRYVFYKENEKGSDKLAEAKAKSHGDVMALREQVNMARYVVDQLKGHLRGMDKSHDNVLNLCYNLRKEISAYFPSDIPTGSSIGNSLRSKEEEVRKILAEKKNE